MIILLRRGMNRVWRWVRRHVILIVLLLLYAVIYNRAGPVIAGQYLAAVLIIYVIDHYLSKRRKNKETQNAKQ